MIVKILKIVQWAISRKPKKLHTLNFYNKYFHKKTKKPKKEKKKKIKIWKLKNYPQFFKNFINNKGKHTPPK
jgi:hypothetical protein